MSTRRGQGSTRRKHLPCPTARTAAASPSRPVRCPRSSPTSPMSAGARSSASARFTSPPTPPGRWRRARHRTRARRLAAPRSRRRRHGPVRAGAPEPRAHASHQDRLRSDGEARTRKAAPLTPEPLRSRRRRARRLRRVRPLPAALPDVPRHRPRDRVAPWPDRGDARGRPTRRRDRRHVLARDGRVRPVPRLRGRVPVRRAVRPSDGGHPRRAPHAAPHPRTRGACPSGSRTSSLLPRHWLLLAATWLLVAAQRLHLVPRRFGLPRISTRSLRPLDVDVGGHPDAWLFTGCVMDAWMRDTHRSTREGHARHRRPRRPSAGSRVVLRRAPRPRRPRRPRHAPSPGASSHRCPATRRSSSTARAAARA